MNGVKECKQIKINRDYTIELCVQFGDSGNAELMGACKIMNVRGFDYD